MKKKKKKELLLILNPVLPVNLGLIIVLIDPLPKFAPPKDYQGSVSQALNQMAEGAASSTEIFIVLEKNGKTQHLRSC